VGRARAGETARDGRVKSEGRWGSKYLGRTRKL
jgi:hypothetical protein